ncbi:MAG: DUF192 domain-containing protein [Planctomycetota bacterium]
MTKPVSSLLSAVLGMFGFFLGGCVPNEPNELDKLGTVGLSIKGQAFELWIADESDEQLKGLMFVTSEQMAKLSNGTERGMIFAFDQEQSGSFWMRNTIIPLDIAYIDSTGKVIKMYTMAPLDERYNQYPPGAPYKFTIEVTANRFGELGLQTGDQVVIPANLLKRR